MGFGRFLSRKKIDSLEKESIMIATWPEVASEKWSAPEEEARMELVQSVINAVRQVRGEHNISPGEETDLIVVAPDAKRRALLEGQSNTFSALINLSDIQFVESHEQSGFAAVGVVEDIQLIVPLSDEKIAEEVKRLEKKRDGARQAVERSKKKLDNPNYAQKAPAKVVEAEREKLKVAETELAQLDEKIVGLS